VESFSCRSILPEYICFNLNPSLGSYRFLTPCAESHVLKGLTVSRTAKSRVLKGHGFSRAVKSQVLKGHGFSRAVNAQLK
jgi:hypothetical protein